MIVRAVKGFGSMFSASLSLRRENLVDRRKRRARLGPPSDDVNG